MDQNFRDEAERILSLEIRYPVHSFNGYGPDGEVIYTAHPGGAPCVLSDQKQAARAVFYSNGSIQFNVKLADGYSVQVLSGNFDTFNKRETGVPESNIWVETGGRAASLTNPGAGLSWRPRAIKIVKIDHPEKCIWYCARFSLPGGGSLATAVRCRLGLAPAGPVLVRDAYLRNTGNSSVNGKLWFYSNLCSTQEFIYNKDIWYDRGLPLFPGEIVIAGTVPYRNYTQIKRVSVTTWPGCSLKESTCDYLDFIGNSGDTAIFPAAVRNGALLRQGAGVRLNRFSTPTVAACRIDFTLARQAWTRSQERLLYVQKEALVRRFEQMLQTREPGYRGINQAFTAAGRWLIRNTFRGGKSTQIFFSTSGKKNPPPAFSVDMPHHPAVAAYLNTAAKDTEELYESSYGGKLADGVEIGTRDRSQHMWSLMKIRPAQVRNDLIHLFSFMYYTGEGPEKAPRRRMSLRRKLHGMFPRQFPSRWNQRHVPVKNDNRPYGDSAIWPVSTLIRYIRETGDVSILLEKVGTVCLAHPDQPIGSTLTGGKIRLQMAEVMLEILASYRRQAADSPYGMAQVLYGDWCDPVDMFGTFRPGDAATRGQGRGTSMRLSGHLFLTLLDAIDLLETETIKTVLRKAGIKLDGPVQRFKQLANELRRKCIRYAWERGKNPGESGFISFIHEFRIDGSVPNRQKGQIGYTLGSYQGRDFDGLKRRELLANAAGLAMLLADREYLAPVPGREAMVREVIQMADRLLFDRDLGLKLFSLPIANSLAARTYVGRMGVVPAGTAENGEYNHAAAMMHYYRLSLAGSADAVWKGFKQLMSVNRDQSLRGPFESTTTSYVADRDDPHFGAGMYFGFSGTTVWMQEVLEKVAGLEINLHDPRRPALAVHPELPRELRSGFTLRRLLHFREGKSGYREIPLTIQIKRTTEVTEKEHRGHGEEIRSEIWINGKRAERAEVWSLRGVKKLDIEITD